MKTNQAKYFLPFVQALAEGRGVQYKTGPSNQWVDVTENCGMLFHDSDEEGGVEYRIKPEPKLRPWTPEEVPLGALVKGIPFGKDIFKSVILSYDNGLIYCGPYCDDRFRNNSPVEAMANWLHSTDGGKTWHPCGVEE